MFGSLAMDPSTAIERHNNFRHIFQSLLVLFRFFSFSDAKKPCKFKETTKGTKRYKNILDMALMHLTHFWMFWTIPIKRRKKLSIIQT